MRSTSGAGCFGALAIALFCALGCKGEAKERVSPVAGTPLELGAACGAGATAAIDQTLRVRLVAGEGINSGELEKLVGQLASFYRPYGLHFERIEAIESVSMASVFAGTNAALEERLLTGRGRDGAGGERDAVMKVVAGPLLSFLKSQPKSPERDVDIVLLPRVTSPRSPLQAHTGEIAGLAIKMGFLPGPAEIVTPDPFEHIPTIFLGKRELDKLEPSIRATTLAHELGHILELSHELDRNNLMHPNRRSDCHPILSESQLTFLQLK